MGSRQNISVVAISILTASGIAAMVLLLWLAFVFVTKNYAFSIFLLWLCQVCIGIAVGRYIAPYAHSKFALAAGGISASIVVVAAAALVAFIASTAIKTESWLIFALSPLVLMLLLLYVNVYICIKMGVQNFSRMN